MVSNITDIDITQKYNGYIWLSNQKQPRVLVDEVLGDFVPNDEAFIVEGFLFDGNNSYSIKFIDGKYLVNKFVVEASDYNDKNVVDKYFVHNKVDKIGNKKLHFLQFWRTKDDEFCKTRTFDGKVLQPAELVFVGFDNPKNKED